MEICKLMQIVLFLCLVLAYLKTNLRENAPHTPRVILLGPTGCGKSVQGELLSSKYGIINGKPRKSIKKYVLRQFSSPFSCDEHLKPHKTMQKFPLAD